MINKVCPGCGIEKPINKFDVRSYIKKNGTISKHYRRVCTACKCSLYRRKRGIKPYTNKQRHEDAITQAKERLAYGYKTCNKCHTEKPLVAFGKRDPNKVGYFDGHEITCKECRRSKGGIYRNSKPTRCFYKLKLYHRLKCQYCKKEFIVLRWHNRKYCCDKCQTKASPSYYKSLQQRRNLYANDPVFREKILQQAKLRHQQDRSKMLARKHKRKSNLLRQHDGSVNANIVRQVMNSRKTCLYCGKRFNGDAELEHLDPICKGGLNSISNLTVACHRCNQLKKHKSFYKFVNNFVPNERRSIVIRTYKKITGREVEQGYLPLKFEINRGPSGKLNRRVPRNREIEETNNRLFSIHYTV